MQSRIKLTASLAPGSTVFMGERVSFTVKARDLQGRPVSISMPDNPPGMIFDPVVDAASPAKVEASWYVARSFGGTRTLVFEAENDQVPPARARLELRVIVGGTTGFNSRTEVGDVTGDGIADVVAAAYLADVGGAEDVGSIYVWAGTSVAPQSTAPSATLRVPGGAAGDKLAEEYLRLADVTGDGILDIVSGAPEATVNGVSRAGAVYVWEGGSSLAGQQNPIAPKITLSEDGVGPDLLFGTGPSTSIYLVDTDGDDIQDILVVAPLADLGGKADVGVACLWYGGETLTGSPLPHASLEVPNAQPGDRLGLGHDQIPVVGWYPDATPGYSGTESTQFADVTGDGLLDVVILASHADGQSADVGAIYVWAAGTRLTGPQEPTAQLRVDTAVEDDRLGYGHLTTWGHGVRLFDLTGDGTKDVLAMAQFADVDGVVDTGAAYLWKGGSTLTGSVAPAARMSAPGASAGDELGRSAADELLDVTGDGYADLVLGSRLANGSVGEAHVFAGGPGLSGDTSPTASLFPSSTAPYTLFTVDSYTDRGIQLADVTGDGVADVLGGAQGATFNGMWDAGAIYVWNGGATLTGSPSPDATLKRGLPVSNDKLSKDGFRIVDLTGDGVLDVLTASTNTKIAGVGHRGALFLFEGGPGLSGETAPLATLKVDNSFVSYFLPLAHGSEGPAFSIADVTGDEKLDVVAASSRAFRDDGAVFVWEGGSWGGAMSQTATLRPAGTGSTQMTSSRWGHPFHLVDVTGDGTLDVIVPDTSFDFGKGKLRVYRGGSSLSGIASAILEFVGPTSNATLGHVAGDGLTFADVTGNGRIDILCGAEQAGTFEEGAVYLLSSPFSTTPPRTLDVPGSAPFDHLGD